MSNQDYSDIHIDSTLPKPWEEETTFNDVLYDWMGRAPWLLISGAAHLVAFFILTSIPWGAQHKPEPVSMTASLEKPPEEIIEEEEEVIEEEQEEVDTLEDPVLVDADVSDQNEVDADQPFESMLGENDNSQDSPFDNNDSSANNINGLGYAGGGGGGGPGGGRTTRKRGGPSKFNKALHDALEWLKKHQASDGSWDTDGFMDECGKVGSGVCGDPGRAHHDVGNTGLALLAFLGEGNTTATGKYKKQVRKGIMWLRTMQDPDTGLIGEQSSQEFIYNHAIATLALCEAYAASKSPSLKRPCQKAINYIIMARTPYAAWRYHVPSQGQSDTSVTGWMVFALKAAKGAGLDVDEGAFDGARSWIDEMTDRSTGRVGYMDVGGPSPRVPAVNDHFPTEKGEAMTAVGLLCRIFMGDHDFSKGSILAKHGDLMLHQLPTWDPDGFGSDMYYWYYGSYGMFQLGGRHWSKWEAALEKAALENQCKDGDTKGSWDPIGPWGFAGGRVYSTALMALCIEVHFRYDHVTGAR